ncbi:hypothetical protein TRAPUB_2473 [Trametes pubescens]|uniref:Uncharacterized protein n=1 Tax=Trametes pubescens TaxID=154538 RepID=A0A1M2VGF0_TRAPU|nr:hypothetical protein TRAPUB_2473 [Trametes pubescens]
MSSDIVTVDDLSESPPFEYSDVAFEPIPIPGDPAIWDGVGNTKLQAFIPDVVTAPVDNVAFFNSNVMPYGVYTLIINVSSASTDSPFYLDYVRYNTTDPSAAVAASTSASVSSTSPTAAATTSAPAPTNLSSSSSPPVGPIVGGVVAGVVAISAVIIAFLCYRMRRRRPGARAPLSPLDPASRMFLFPLQSISDDLAHHLVPTASVSRITPYVVPAHARSQSRFSEGLPTAASALYSPGMREVAGASAYSLGASTSAGEPVKGYYQGSGKGARVSPGTQHRQYNNASPGASAYAASSSGAASSYAGPGPASAFGGTHSHPNPNSRAHASPSPMSSVHDLPNFVGRGSAGHTKGQRSEAEALLAGSELGVGVGAGVGVGVQEDSGVRFEPGVTPSDVAPVLPPGAVPIRSAATQSEVARADVPPAYTFD